MAGAILGRAGPASHQALADYARDLGLAFQIVDDLLDVEGDAKSLGKGVGKDAGAGKATFVSVLGVDDARTEALRLVAAAIAPLDCFGAAAAPLRDVARFVISRDH